MSIPNAVYETINEGSTRYAQSVIDETNKIVKVADNLNEQGETKLSQQAYDMCFDIIKEAQLGERGWGGWIADKFRGKEQSVKNRLDNTLKILNVLRLKFPAGRGGGLLPEQSKALTKEFNETMAGLGNELQILQQIAADSPKALQYVQSIMPAFNAASKLTFFDTSDAISSSMKILFLY